MRKTIIIAVSLVFIFTGSIAFADNTSINKNSTWEEIKADKNLKIVYPMISVGNGLQVSSDNFYIQDDVLKTGKTHEVGIKWTENSEGDRTYTETVIVNVETPVEYTYQKAIEWKTDSEGIKYPVKYEKANRIHATTKYASIYKKSTKTGEADTLLFTKAFTIPRM